MSPEKQQKNNKIATIDSIMNNPKLSRIIHEAASAPLGSTKRDKAKSIISIINKSNPNSKPNGQGGPGGLFDNPTLGISSLGNSNSISSNPNADFFKTLSLNNSGYDSSGLFGAGSSSVTIFPDAGNLRSNNYSPLGLSSLSNSLASNYSSFNSITPKNNDNYKPMAGIKSNISTDSMFNGNNPQDSGLSSGGKNLMTKIPSFDLPKKDTSSPNSNISSDGKALVPGGPVDTTETTKTKADGTKITSKTEKPTTVNTETTNAPTVDYSQYGRTKEFDSTATKDSISLWDAITSQEGSSYTTVNKDSGALGKYQLMPFNLGYAGLKNTPQDIQTFLSNPQLQDEAIAKYRADLEKNYNGDPAKIAAAYYGGSLGANNYGTPKGDIQGKYDKNGNPTGYPSVNEYVAQVLARTTGENTSGGIYNTSSSGSGTDLQTAWAALPEAIQKQYGPELFAKLMQGASLTQQEEQLKQTLTQEYDLNNLLAKKNEMENMTPTVKQDMTDYIKGRDTYVKKIDNMINSVNSTMASTDISNPVTNKMYTDYKNYLLTLKGRQNQRYTEYLNRSIEQYNTDLTGIQNQYQNAVTSYNSALKSGDDLLENQYKETHDILVNMYNSLEKGPQTLADRQKAMNELNTTALSTASSISGYKQDYLSEESSYADRITDKTSGELLPGTNLPSLIEQLSVGIGKNPQGVVDSFTRAAIIKLESLTSSSDPNAFKQAMEYIQQLDDVIGSTTSNLPDLAKQQLAPVIADAKQSLLSKVQGQTSLSSTTQKPTGLVGYLTANAKDIGKIAKELSGEKIHWYSGKPSYPTRDQLIKEYSGINADIVGAIWDQDQIMKKQYGESATILDTVKSVAQQNNTTGDTSFAKLSTDEQIAEYLAAQILATPNFNSSLT